MALPKSGPDASTQHLRIQHLRSVQRATADLRRGTPVVLRAPESLVLLPAETAGTTGLEEFAALAAETPQLLLSRSRVDRLRLDPASPLNLPVSDIVALALSRPLLEPALLRGLADPTEELRLPEPLRLAASCPDAAGVALELAKLARLLPAVLAARIGPDAFAEADAMGLLAVSEEHIGAFAEQAALSLRKVAETRVPLEDAPDTRVVAFRAPGSGIEHLAILVGPAEACTAPLVRIHSECFTGDLLGSLRCDCGPQLRGAIRRMAKEGAGVLLYLAQEGRGIGLLNKLRAYTLQDDGLDTLDANRALGWGADERDYGIAATMLRELGISHVRLLTNNPDKLAALAAHGLTVVREAHTIAANGVNDGYLATKSARFGHLFD